MTQQPRVFDPELTELTYPREAYDPLVSTLAGWTQDPDYSTVAWNAALTSDMIFTQPVLYQFPLLKPETLLIIEQRDRTAFGRAWAPNSVADTLGNYPLTGRSVVLMIVCELGG